MKHKKEKSRILEENTSKKPNYQGIFRKQEIETILIERFS